ncbi:MAG: putative phosphoenolpyruvate phosphomutase [Patescibacteria group bacterium]|nr:putative phosphoenolpyruvate phosphomutase [Patescibacteria group bacterium]
MAADIIHPGHLNIIDEGAKLGDVVVGLLTDSAIAAYKRVPHMRYDQRLAVVEHLKGVGRVVAQEQLDYRPNLRKLKPDYLLHGSDWQAGVMNGPRQQARETMAEWGGEVVEPAYTEGISSTRLISGVKEAGVSPDARLAQLTRLLEVKPTIRGMEAHNGLSAHIVDRVTVPDANGVRTGFDVIWISSLTDSMAKGKPDNESVDFSSRLVTINQVLEASTKPVIVDGDSGGHDQHFAQMVRTLERLGVSAVVIEDKAGLKRNSLHEDTHAHIQETKEAFSRKIRAGIKARRTDNFMVIARIESLIVGSGHDDAIERAKAYLGAGASAIMIHSKDATGADVKRFSKVYNTLPNRRPLMMVPTSYNAVSEAELTSWGANIVVYANHLLRAAYPAMEQAAQKILQHGRALEAEQLCLPIPDFLKLITDE